ncbi:uncharacterized protein LOC129872414 [Solanum dulcamara]|uniref:uncharacterized protein LOC129872414 n=1 Tax=Solanum dulcamara TaxID=45834 RepID=UPI00248681F1|nr:uncharacterized protein LOC129872414 [Solanum dulcamara]
MMNTICWNARSIDTQGALDRLQKLKDYHSLSMLAILEPFAHQSQINQYKNQLRMNNACHNPNNKIWLFWNQDVDCHIRDQDEQQVADIDTFLDTVKTCWDRHMEGNPMRIFHQGLHQAGQDRDGKLQEKKIKKDQTTSLNYFYLQCSNLLFKLDINMTSDNHFEGSTVRTIVKGRVSPASYLPRIRVAFFFFFPFLLLFDCAGTCTHATYQSTVGGPAMCAAYYAVA